MVIYNIELSVHLADHSILIDQNKNLLEQERVVHDLKNSGNDPAQAIAELKKTRLFLAYFTNSKKQIKQKRG